MQKGKEQPSSESTGQEEETAPTDPKDDPYFVQQLRYVELPAVKAIKGFADLDMPPDETWRTVDIWEIESYGPGEYGAIELKMKSGDSILIALEKSDFDKLFDASTRCKGYILQEQA